MDYITVTNVNVHHIELTPEQWDDLRDQIKRLHGIAASMLSWKMQELFGLTVRHAQYAGNVELFFHDEPKYIWFMMQFIVKKP